MTRPWPTQARRPPTRWTRSSRAATEEQPVERHDTNAGRGSGRPGPGPARRARGPTRRQRRRRTPGWLPWLLQTPALIVLGGLLVFPLIWVVVLSFQDFNLRELVTGEVRWIGLGNFREILSDPLLWKVALPNTAVFAAVTSRSRWCSARSSRCCCSGSGHGPRHPDQRDHGGLGDARRHRHLRLGLRLRRPRRHRDAPARPDRPGRPGDHELVHRTDAVLRHRHAERRAPRVPLRRRHGARGAPHGAARAAGGRGDGRRRALAAVLDVTYR